MPSYNLLPLAVQSQHFSNIFSKQTRFFSHFPPNFRSYLLNLSADIDYQFHRHVRGHSIRRSQRVPSVPQTLSLRFSPSYLNEVEGRTRCLWSCSSPQVSEFSLPFPRNCTSPSFWEDSSPEQHSMQIFALLTVIIQTMGVV